MSDELESTIASKRVMGAITDTLDAIVANLADFNRRLSAIEAELATRRGSVAAWGRDSEPMTLTPEPRD